MFRETPTIKFNEILSALLQLLLAGRQLHMAKLVDGHMYATFPCLSNSRAKLWGIYNFNLRLCFIKICHLLWETKRQTNKTQSYAHIQ
jgi:hypothetical protein